MTFKGYDGCATCSGEGYYTIREFDGYDRYDTNRYRCNPCYARWLSESGRGVAIKARGTHWHVFEFSETGDGVKYYHTYAQQSALHFSRQELLSIFAALLPHIAPNVVALKQKLTLTKIHDILTSDQKHATVAKQPKAILS